MVKKVELPEDAVPTDGKVFVPYYRTKVAFSFKYDPKNTGDDKEIQTKVYVDDNETPETIESVSDIAKLMTFKSTVQYLLMVNKMWVSKCADLKTKQYDCGVSVKCLQIKITGGGQPGAESLSQRLTFSVFAKDSAVKRSSDLLETKQELLAIDDEKSSSDSSDSSSEEEVQPKKKSVKGKPVKVTETESEDSDSSAAAPPAPKAKKSKK